MNILVITQSSTSNITGGQSVNRYIYRRFADKGHDVRYSTQYFNFSSIFEFMFKLIYNIRLFSKFDHIIMDSSTHKKTLPFVILYRMFNGRSKISCIHHHFLYMSINGWKRELYKTIEYLFLKQCGHVIVVSPYIYEICKKSIPENRIHFCPLAFDKSDAIQTDKVPFSLLYVGTIEERKGLRYLIDAFEYIPDPLRSKITLNIVGKTVSEQYKKILCDNINSLGLESNIIFLGRVTDEELQRLYSQSMVFTFPSLLEGYGMVLIEAMKHHMPVICFNNTAMPYTVKNGYNGIVVENHSTIGFADAIEKLFSDNKLYEKTSSGAFITYKNCRSFKDLDADIDDYLNRINPK